jgi:hypothetical protein
LLWKGEEEEEEEERKKERKKDTGMQVHKHV